MSYVDKHCVYSQILFSNDESGAGNKYVCSKHMCCDCDICYIKKYADSTSVDEMREYLNKESMMHVFRKSDTRKRIAENVYTYTFDLNTKKLVCLGKCDILKPDNWIEKRGEARFITDDSRFYYTSTRNKTVSNEEGIALVRAGRYFIFWLYTNDKEAAMKCAKKECKDYAEKLIKKYQYKINKTKETFSEYL